MSPQCDIDAGDFRLARAVRFYGLEPDAFLKRMPMSRMNNFLKAVPYLEASEQLARINATTIGMIPDGKARYAAVRHLTYLLEKINPSKPDWDRITVLKRRMEQKGKRRRKK